jgi:hypothetical protein
MGRFLLPVLHAQEHPYSRRVSGHLQCDRMPLGYH